MKNLILKLFPSLNADTVYIFLLGMFWTLALLLVLVVLVVLKVLVKVAVAGLGLAWIIMKD